MKKKIFHLVGLAVVFVFTVSCWADEEIAETGTPFSSFTGRVTRNKVRLRLEPSLHSHIVKEVGRGTLLAIVGETEDFLEVVPPSDTKLYVYRTFILDGKVEGDRVNVRLEPDLQAPVVTQASSGESVKGIISPLNSKWMEVEAPAAARFYIAKGYVENAGKPEYLTEMQDRREEVTQELNSAYLSSQSELRKPYIEINLQSIIVNFNDFIASYPDFPDLTSRAQELLTLSQEAYNQKKIAYLESMKTNDTWTAKNEELNTTIESCSEKLNELEERLKQHAVDISTTNSMALSIPETDPALKSSIAYGVIDWGSVEATLFEEWKANITIDTDSTLQGFYTQEQEKATSLTGILTSYSRPVKNRPGDYLLTEINTGQPIAYLYSTQVDLSQKLNQQVTVVGTPRSNHHFALPAYYALAVE